MTFIQKIMALFRTVPTAPAYEPATQAAARRKSARMTLSDFILLELKRGTGTTLEIAERIKSHSGSVGNLLSIMQKEGKVKQVAKRGRYIVWGLA